MLPDVGSTIVPPGLQQPVALGRVDHRDRDAVLDAAAGIRRLELGDERAAHAFGAAARGAGARAACARRGRGSNRPRRSAAARRPCGRRYPADEAHSRAAARPRRKMHDGAAPRVLDRAERASRPRCGRCSGTAAPIVRSRRTSRRASRSSIPATTRATASCGTATSRCRSGCCRAASASRGNGSPR